MVNQEMDKLMSATLAIFKRIVIIGVIALIIILFYKYASYQEKVKTLEELNTTLDSKLEIYKTKDGLNAAKIKVFESNSTKDFIKLATRDSTILKLKELVKINQSKIKTQGSIAIINTETNVDTAVPTEIIDSINKYPIYKSNFNLKGWIWGSSIANKDSTSYKINYKEELSLVVGREKTGFLGLGRGTPFADVTLHNPYSSVKEMRVYQKESSRPKRFSIGPTLSYGIGEGFEPQVFIGIGISYNLIRF